MINYLTPEFINNVNTRDADYLVARYGTHVLLDISLGGRLKFAYSASIGNQSEYDQKVTSTEAGLSGYLNKIGINLSLDVSTEEITKALSESRNQDFSVSYFWGDKFRDNTFD